MIDNHESISTKKGGTILERRPFQQCIDGSSTPNPCA